MMGLTDGQGVLHWIGWVIGLLPASCPQSDRERSGLRGRHDSCSRRNG